VLDGIVDREPIRNVATRAVDVDRDRPGAVVGQFPKPFNRGAGGVLLDVTDELNIPKAVRLLFSDNLFNRLYQFVENLVVDFAHHSRCSHASCRTAGWARVHPKCMESQ
jgi:hypothetical protein